VKLARTLRHRPVEPSDDGERRALAGARESPHCKQACAGRGAMQMTVGADHAGDGGPMHVDVKFLAQRVEISCKDSGELGMPLFDAGIDHGDEDLVAIGELVRLRRRSVVNAYSAGSTMARPVVGGSCASENT